MFESDPRPAKIESTAVGKEHRSPLEKLADSIWLADGPLISFYGFPYPTRMVIIRLRGGSLWIWSPIPLSVELKEAVDSLGTVDYLVSPNKLHHLYLKEWLLEWSNARLYASPGLVKRRPDLSFDDVLGMTPDPSWSSEIDQIIVRGSFFMDEVVFFHCASRTVLIADLIQRFDPRALSGWRHLLMKLDGLVGPDGSTPREWRWSFWNRSAARQARQAMLEWDPERVVIAHGEWVRQGGRDVMARALRWMG